MFNNAEIAAIFLDKSLAIKQFTPRTNELVHLIPADIGRPLKHFSISIKNFNLIDASEEVLNTHTHKAVEVQGTNERWYLIKISPYRTFKNMIDGIIITIMDITQSKLTAENLTKVTRECHDTIITLNYILDAMHESAVILNKELIVVSLNRFFIQKFLVNENEAMGHSFYEIADEQWNIPDLRQLLDQVIKDNRVVEGYELEHEFPHIGYKKLRLTIRTMIHNEMDYRILLIIEEIPK